MHMCDILYIKKTMVMCEFNVRQWGVCAFVKNVSC